VKKKTKKRKFVYCGMTRGVTSYKLTNLVSLPRQTPA
jgi:hypothetical protein